MVSVLENPNVYNVTVSSVPLHTHTCTPILASSSSLAARPAEGQSSGVGFGADFLAPKPAMETRQTCSWKAI